MTVNVSAGDTGLDVSGYCWLEWWTRFACENAEFYRCIAPRNAPDESELEGCQLEAERWLEVLRALWQIEDERRKAWGLSPRLARSPLAMRGGGR